VARTRDLWKNPERRGRGKRWWARREVKPDKTAPPRFVALGTDEETGKTVGWEPIEQSAFERWHADALNVQGLSPWPYGTYELLGPKVNGNPEGFQAHLLLLHDAAALATCLGCSGAPGGHGLAPRDFDGLAAWLHAHPYEGIVWHDGPGGVMAKIKKRDFPA